MAGCWVARAELASSPISIEIFEDVDPDEEALNTAAGLLKWIQANEHAVRAFIAGELKAGNASSNMNLGPLPPIQDPPVQDLSPYKMVFWGDRVEVGHHCDYLSEHNLFGAQQVHVEVGADKSLSNLELLDHGFDICAERIYSQPLPEDARDFENSIADQFIAAAATGPPLRLDDELRELLQEAIQDVQRRIESGSTECASYMRSVKARLLDIASAARTAIVRIFVQIECRHSSGKFDPFKKMLSIAPEDGAQFDRAGKRATLRLLFINRGQFAKGKDGFQAYSKVVNDGFLAVAKLLAKQHPAAFQDARAAGYEVKVVIAVMERPGQDPVVTELPSEFLSECGRHGLSVTMVTEHQD